MGVVPPKYILDTYNYFPKAENDSTHTKRKHQNASTNSPPTQDHDIRNIRTHQITVQKSRQDRTTDHGSTSPQTALPTPEQSEVREYLHFTYIWVVMYTAPNLSLFLFSLHRLVMPCKYFNYETCYGFVAVASAFRKYTFSILLFYISICF